MHVSAARERSRLQHAPIGVTELIVIRRPFKHVKKIILSLLFLFIYLFLYATDVKQF